MLRAPGGRPCLAPGLVSPGDPWSTQPSGWGGQRQAATDPAPRRTHMQNIKDITSSIHFEAYRVKRLSEGSSTLANGLEKEPDAEEM